MGAVVVFTNLACFQFHRKQHHSAHCFDLQISVCEADDQGVSVELVSDNYHDVMAGAVEGLQVRCSRCCCVLPCTAVGDVLQRSEAERFIQGAAKAYMYRPLQI